MYLPFGLLKPGVGLSSYGRLCRKSDQEKFEARILSSLTSRFPSRARKAEQTLALRAEEQPGEIVDILLRNHDHEDERVRTVMRNTLASVAEQKEGLALILERMSSPNRDIRRAAQSSLGSIVGAHAATYASFYEQTILLVAMSKRKDIPVGDIVALAEVSKHTFVDGEVMEAIKDIAFCLDSIKHRFRSSEQLKDYLADVLKMAPNLSRMGISSTIEEPLHKAMSASRHRSYDETREIIEARTRESVLRTSLVKMSEDIMENITERPIFSQEEPSQEDIQVLIQSFDLVDSITSLMLADRRSEAIEMLIAFMQNTLTGSASQDLKRRVRLREPAALFILYNVSLVCLKLASSIQPIMAERVYQKAFRRLEGEPSIHVVMWPEEIMRMATKEAEQSSEMSTAPT